MERTARRWGPGSNDRAPLVAATGHVVLSTESSFHAPEVAVFAFFSNRLGCFGSLVVSIIGTIILIVLMNLLF